MARADTGRQRPEDTHRAAPSPQAAPPSVAQQAQPAAQEVEDESDLEEPPVAALSIKRAAHKLTGQPSGYRARGCLIYEDTSGHRVEARPGELLRGLTPGDTATFLQLDAIVPEWDAA